MSAVPALPFPPSALRALGARVFALWVLVHALAFVVLVMSGAAESAAVAARPNPLWVTAVCVALLLADARRRGERALWGNLGVSTVQLAAFGAVVSVLGETLLAVVMR